jgi:hypothetical protein
MEDLQYLRVSMVVPLTLNFIQPPADLYPLHGEPPLSLSTELLLLTHSSCPIIQAAALFSGTSQRLRAVWLEHGHHIVASILKPYIPAYEDAVHLTILENTWTDNSHPVNPVRIYLCLPRLLHNADLAASATAAWDAHLRRTRYRKRIPLRTYASKQTSYDLARKLVLARKHPESKALLLPALLNTLVTSSTETLHTHQDLIDFLTFNDSTHEERLRHGISKPEEEWGLYDVYDDVQDVPIIRDEWEWVRDVVEVAMKDRLKYHHILSATAYLLTDQPRPHVPEAVGTEAHRADPTIPAGPG